MTIKNWFESRNLRVLNYQQKAIVNVQDSLSEQEIVILAACPSAGKTLMTINIVENYLLNNPTYKVLVLTHGTTILRTQFHDVLEIVKPDFTYTLVEKFTEYDNSKQVNVCLPQTLNNKILSHVDLIVVDEAHQFYFADMVKEIIEKTQPKKQLLLTGTPSPFILRNMPIIPITLNTIFDEDMISDVYVEIATSNYKFDLYDYNQDDELKENIIFKQSDTKKTLDDLLHKVVNKLKSIKGNELINFTDWLPTLLKLQKTMFACRSQRQAMQVKNYFDKINIKSVLSISDTDYDSKEIQNFKDDKDCLVLIVVGRGILGFNYPELVNVVDMTTSQNIDRIYQLLCRVVRKHPNGEKKLFFKIAPNTMSDYYKFRMTCVLNLLDEYFYTHFNGRNADTLKIPVLRVKREYKKRTNINEPKPRQTALIYFDLPLMELFKDIYHKKDSLLHTYAQTTVRNVRAEFMNRNCWTKEKCIESALKYQRRIDWMKNDNNAYNAARKNGWLNDCTTHMLEIRILWTKEKCIEDAKKFTRIVDWGKNSYGAVHAARKNGWFDECIEHMIRIKINWTKEMCIESALKYKMKKDWEFNENGAYSAARRNNWFDECTEHMISPYKPYKPKNYWTKEKCIESAKKYKSKKEWRENDTNAYLKALKYKWFDDCIKHMIVNVKNTWNKEKCIESARKYETYKEWRKNESGAIVAAHKNGWYEECTVHMIRLIREPLTKEECIESAKKYKTRNEWRKNEGGAYNAARKNGWFEECITHMKEKIQKKTYGYWTKEKCIESAKKYKTRNEWKLNENWAYDVARKKSWFEECTAHMIMPIKQKSDGYWTKEKCIESARKYETRNEWRKNEGGAYMRAHKNGWLEECTAHMMQLIRKPWTKEKCIESAKKYDSISKWIKNEASAYNAAHKHGWLEEIKKLYFNKK